MRGDSHSHSAFDARMSVNHVRAATWARCGLWRRRSGESVGGHIPGFGLTRGRAGVPSGLGGKAPQAKMAVLLRGPNGHYYCILSYLIITTERHMSVPCGEAGRPYVHGPAGLETKIVKI